MWFVDLSVDGLNHVPSRRAGAWTGKIFENQWTKPDTGEKNRDVDSIPPAVAARPSSGRKSCRNLKAIRKVL